MPASDPPFAPASDAETRAFVVRIRQGFEAGGRDLVVTVDDVLHQKKTHCANLEAAFAEIRKAMKQSGTAPGQPQ